MRKLLGFVSYMVLQIAREDLRSPICQGAFLRLSQSQLFPLDKGSSRPRAEPLLLLSVLGGGCSSAPGPAGGAGASRGRSGGPGPAPAPRRRF